MFSKGQKESAAEFIKLRNKSVDFAMDKILEVAKRAKKKIQTNGFAVPDDSSVIILSCVSVMLSDAHTMRDWMESHDAVMAPEEPSK